ncbi:phosphoribosyltransferase family protein [Pelagicoccus sp. SDUM812003]|uniref:phosphoribosyltransferase family protein n=1 Tax=Pelagicoccus sp. SDUM812003 TaxID=3041267 RepID=UPI00280FAB7C|nr:phosphoribosyltransferase family protein [Pelagicoccus sp. SDUM812003]MDQ8204654.1 phosphoribosyltransferase family protein [Pelagicoccus sp. SDUM812003]
MNYRSVSNLCDQLVQWTHELPRDLDLIVGVPRSGLLVANLLALYTNVPMSDVKGYLDGRILSTGPRFKGRKIDLKREGLKVLVVDDSLRSGGQLSKVKQSLSELSRKHTILYGAVYVRPGTQTMVDYACELLDTPRVFEWNILHHDLLEESCVDIDGVLCRDPSEMENDDGDRYRDFISSVPPFNLPSQPIGRLVTCRLEKYRDLTEAWLEKHGVVYKELVMMDLPDAQARRKARSHGSYKAEVYKRTRSRLFIESSITQAIEISNASDMPVFCMDTRQMIYPGVEPGISKAKLSSRVHWFLLNARRHLSQMIRKPGLAK